MSLFDMYMCADFQPLQYFICHMFYGSGDRTMWEKGGSSSANFRIVRFCFMKYLPRHVAYGLRTMSSSSYLCL